MNGTEEGKTAPDGPEREPGSISSEQTEAPPQFDAVVDLGRRLVKGLGLSRTDTLGRWMAHYVADLIDAAGGAPLESQAEAKQKCFESILELWRHRTELPDGARPFEQIEPVMRAIRSLDPSVASPRYFQEVRAAIDLERESSGAKFWLEFAGTVDSATKALIGYALREAARTGAADGAEWVTLAENAGVVAAPNDAVVQYLLRSWESGEGSDPNRLQREKLQWLIGQLDALIEGARPVAERWRGELDSLADSSE